MLKQSLLCRGGKEAGRLSKEKMPRALQCARALTHCRYLSLNTLTISNHGIEGIPAFTTELAAPEAKNK